MTCDLQKTQSDKQQLYDLAVINVVVTERCSDTRLRSSSRGDFCIPQTNLRLSDKAFSVAGPRAWNSLPVSVRLTATKSTFFKHLKTHLFRVSYGHLS